MASVFGHGFVEVEQQIGDERPCGQLGRGELFIGLGFAIADRRLRGVSFFWATPSIDRKEVFPNTAGSDSVRPDESLLRSERGPDSVGHDGGTKYRRLQRLPGGRLDPAPS